MEEHGLGSLQELSEAEHFYFKNAAVTFFFFCIAVMDSSEIWMNYSFELLSKVKYSKLI